MPRHRIQHGMTIAKILGNWSYDRDDFGDAINFIGWYTNTSNKRWDFKGYLQRVFGLSRGIGVGIRWRQLQQKTQVN